jgi:hypothetical protein
MHYNEFSKEYSDSFILWDVYNQKRRKTSCDTISGVWGGGRHVGHILPKEVVGIATIIEFDDNYRFFTTSCE